MTGLAFLKFNGKKLTLIMESKSTEIEPIINSQKKELSPSIRNTTFKNK